MEHEAPWAQTWTHRLLAGHKSPSLGGLGRRHPQVMLSLGSRLSFSLACPLYRAPWEEARTADSPALPTRRAPCSRQQKRHSRVPARLVHDLSPPHGQVPMSRVPFLLCLLHSLPQDLLLLLGEEVQHRFRIQRSKANLQPTLPDKLTALLCFASVLAWLGF